MADQLYHFLMISNDIRNADPIVTADGRADTSLPPNCLIDNVPYYRISASSYRGQTRREEFRIITVRLIERHGEQFQHMPADVVYCAIGGNAGSSAQKITDVGRNQRLQDVNPIVSGFGSGAPFLAGHIEVGDLISVDPIPMTETGDLKIENTHMARGNPLTDGTIPARHIADPALVTRLSELNNIRSQLAKTLKKGKRNPELTPADLSRVSALLGRPIASRAEAETAQKEIEATIKSLGGSDVSTNLFLPYDAHIPRGVRFRHRVALRYLPPEPIGLYLAARARIARFDSNRVGGRGAAGFGGHLTSTYRVLVVEDDNWKFDCTVRFEPPDENTQGGMTITPAGSTSRLEDCYKAWMECDIGRFDFRDPRLMDEMVAPILAGDEGGDDA